MASTCLCASGAIGEDATDFYAYWGDGKAELNTYQVVQPRYGELRQGHGVLVFVTEDLNRNTLIKVETPTPAQDRRYALKLNNVLKFNTGIYDYSVMTSVFSFVESQGGKGFEFAKVSLTAQEWCGHVFDEVRLAPDGLRGRLLSYFEAEGNRDYRLEHTNAFASEDHLLIRIRELQGEIMQSGDSRQVELLPSLWQLRRTHADHALVSAVLHKGQVEQLHRGGRSERVVPWRWTVGEGKRSVTVWVGADYPHRIVRWRSSEGGSGELLTSIRQPYWKLNSNVDEALRQRLELPW